MCNGVLSKLQLCNRLIQPHKTKALFISCGESQSSSLDLVLNNVNIKSLQSVKYLGIILDSKLDLDLNNVRIKSLQSVSILE